MFADTFNNCVSTGVTNGKTFTGYTTDISSTACCTIESNVTGNNVFICFIISFLRRIKYNLTTGETFTHVIVAVTAES